jgi:hypothetical protein
MDFLVRKGSLLGLTRNFSTDPLLTILEGEVVIVYAVVDTLLLCDILVAGNAERQSGLVWLE